MSAPACRVFLLYKHSLFAEGVLALLCQHKEVEVLGAEVSPTIALPAIHQLHPDVVIVEGAEDDPAYTIARIQHDCPNSRLISLSLEKDQMQVYDSFQIPTPHPADLIGAILVARGSTASSPTEG